MIIIFYIQVMAAIIPTKRIVYSGVVEPRSKKNVQMVTGQENAV